MKPTEDEVEAAVTAFEVFLRDRQLKMTEQRRTMVRVVLAKRGHFTADELYRKLLTDGESVSMATVYRALALLEEGGVVEGHDFADGQRRYERALDREHHDHMICVDCRAVIEFTNEQIEHLQHEVAQGSGFTLKDHSLQLFVTCDEWHASGACERRSQREARRSEAQA
ncbi:MAG: Fur family transcriptional regulator [Planctomycetota bacterium]|nr:Fur family transcriptional regulator [Planctomycetota bacterium]